MSEYSAIRGVTRTLRALLMQHITNSSDPDLGGIPIDLRSPKEMREDSEAKGVSLWLYRVVRNGFTHNKPLERLSSTQLHRQSLSIDLYFLITPIANTSDDEQLLLGKVLQVFNDHPTLRGALLQDSLQGGSEEFRLILEPLSLEEVTRVWDALKEPYQLSVSYLVQVVDIDSAREALEIAPVGIKETQYLKIKTVT